MHHSNHQNHFNHTIHFIVPYHPDWKMALAGEKGMTREAYTKGKTGFILHVLMEMGVPASELDEIADSNR